MAESGEHPFAPLLNSWSRWLLSIHLGLVLRLPQLFLTVSSQTAGREKLFELLTLSPFTCTLPFYRCQIHSASPRRGNRLLLRLFLALEAEHCIFHLSLPSHPPVSQIRAILKSLKEKREISGITFFTVSLAMVMFWTYLVFLFYT